MTVVIEKEEEEKQYSQGKEFIKKFTLAMGGIGDPNDINFRRNHPNLGKKIAELHRRVTTLEQRLELIVFLLKDILKQSYVNQMKEAAEDFSDTFVRNL